MGCPTLADQVKNLVDSKGLTAAAKSLQISTQTLAKLGAGMTVHPAIVESVSRRLNGLGE